MRVAVIGHGSAGRRHATNLEALGCEVERFDWAEQDGVRPALEWVPRYWDAVVVSTPWDCHLRYVEAAVAVGIPVFCEKPLGSLEQIPRWRELVKAAEDLTTQVGYQLRFHPRYRAMRQLVPEPEFGEFTCDFDMGRWPGKAYGPPELEASHELDLALDCGLGRESVILNSGEPEYFRGWSLDDDNASACVQFFSPEELGDQMYVDEMAHFLDCVKEGKQTICPLSDGLRVLEALA